MSGKLPPQFMQVVLWSYDLAKIDRDQDWKLIITQGLNFGSEQVVSWIKENYSDDQIKYVVTHPTRGMWFRERLQKWVTYFDLILDPLIFEIGVRDLNPRPVLTEAYFDRIGVKLPVKYVRKKND
ncbi:MAG: hypothetical protein Q8L51_03870 [Candidatus Amesbacteria bacterium]|nr:hypothetical protein [Candidatus Amesbacteria bacterium]